MDRVYVEEIVQKYLKDCECRRRLSSKTVKAYRIDLTQFIDFSNYQINNENLIIDYMFELSQNYSKPKTIKRKIASIKAFYSFLEFNEIINVSLKRVKMDIKEPKMLPKTISNMHIEMVLSYVYKEISQADTEYKRKQSVRNATVIELLFSTGIRISELCNIKVKDIDMPARLLKIFGKGSKERIIYIGNDNVIKILNNYMNLYKEEIKTSEFLFLNKFNDRLSEQAVRIFLKKIEQELGENVHITPHMFRHTFATMLLEKDVDIRYIQKILGHSSISVTEIYTHVSSSKQKEILLLKNPRNDYSSFY